MKSSIIALSVCFVLLWTACRPVTPLPAEMPKVDTAATVPDSLLLLIHSGDLILRAGKDEISQLFRRLNTHDQTYSHCGIAFITDSGYRVCHVVVGPGNPSGKVLMEPLSSFVNARENEAWAVFRFGIDSAANSAFCDKMFSFYKQRIRFDQQFDLATDNKMYCSEMVYKALLATTKDTGFIHATIAFSGKPYIAIDNLFGNKHCQTICEIAY